MATSGGGWGYPPMSTLEGAVPGWPEGTTLTSAAAPETARAVLQAEESTSVLHAAGLRWGVVRRVGWVVFLVAWLWAAVAAVRHLVEGAYEGIPGGLWVAIFIAFVSARLLPWAWLRVEPSSGGRLSTSRERLGLDLAVLRGAVTTAPAATWPTGAEAYALLATAEKAHEIDPPWLLDRAGLPAGVGGQWLDFMGRCGWLTGGDASLGRWLRQPVRITDAGREQLEQERARLRGLADTPV